MLTLNCVNPVNPHFVNKVNSTETIYRLSYLNKKIMLIIYDTAFFYL